MRCNMNWIPAQAEVRAINIKMALERLTETMMEPVNANILTYEAQQYILRKVVVLDGMRYSIDAMLREIDTP